MKPNTVYHVREDGSLSESVEGRQWSVITDENGDVIEFEPEQWLSYEED